MLNLVLTTDLVDVSTDSAANLAVTACGTDFLSGATTGTLWKQNTAISSISTPTIVAAPAASTVRNVKTIHIANTHATLAVVVEVRYNANGTTYRLRRETLLAGDQLDYVEGVGFYRTAASASALLIRTLTADATGIDSLNAQPIFPATGSATPTGGTTYWFQARVVITRAAGAVSHTTSFLLGGTATYTAVDLTAWSNTGDVLTTLPTSETDINVATAVAFKAASTSATEAIELALDGKIIVNAGGTLIPQFKFSAAPGGAPTIKRGSYVILTPWGGTGFSAQGPWA